MRPFARAHSELWPTRKLGRPCLWRGLRLTEQVLGRPAGARRRGRRPRRNSRPCALPVPEPSPRGRPGGHRRCVNCVVGACRDCSRAAPCQAGVPLGQTSMRTCLRQRTSSTSPPCPPQTPRGLAALLLALKPGSSKSAANWMPIRWVSQPPCHCKCKCRTQRCTPLRCSPAPRAPPPHLAYVHLPPGRFHGGGAGGGGHRGGEDRAHRAAVQPSSGQPAVTQPEGPARAAAPVPAD